MPRRKPPSKPRPPRAPAKRRRDSCRVIVVIDQAPLRRRASAESRKLMKSLEGERLKLQVFEREDRPAFERWMAGKFGQVLTELREIAARIAEKSALMAEIQDEMFFGGCASHHAAWQRVKIRREARARGAAPPDDDEEEEEEWSDDDPFGLEDDDPIGFDSKRGSRESNQGPPNDEEVEELFHEFLRDLFGIGPGQLDRRAYAKMLRDFKVNVLGMDAAPPRRQSGLRGEQAGAPDPRRARVKELYRLLVRRLHPDVRADGDPNVSALWHEVQAAYAAGDVDRLETLLAFTDVRDNRAGAQTSLSQWFGVIAELKAALKAVRSSLRRARADRAWNFVRRSDRDALEKKAGAEMAKTLAGERAKLEVIEATLELWSKPPPVRQRGPGKRRRQPAFGQEEFWF